MSHALGAVPAFRRTPLSADERARFIVNMTELVGQMVVAKGRFRVTADTPEMVELFQIVARRVGDLLQRPLVSYSNGRDIVITFAGSDELTV
ncbi:hypothetical protein GCM10022226_02040 [Sphaerisporangium flaviroseum]|uniref:Uncharacterized protein n=1 Tax=Sphaerisporangium flaviroseum TaxID=509199 RepID=A0ABP7H9M4_9ACTN